MCILRAIADSFTSQVETSKQQRIASQNSDLCLLTQRIVAVFGLVISLGLAIAKPHPLFIFSTAFFLVYVISLFCDCSETEVVAVPLRDSADRINVTIVTQPQPQPRILPISMSAGSSSLQASRPVVIHNLAQPSHDSTARAPLGSRMDMPPPRPRLDTSHLAIPQLATPQNQRQALQLDVTRRVELGTRSQEHASVTSPLPVSGQAPDLLTRPSAILANALATERSSLEERVRVASPHPIALQLPQTQVPRVSPQSSAFTTPSLYPTLTPHVDTQARAVLGSRTSAPGAVNAQALPNPQERAKLGERAQT